MTLLAIFVKDEHATTITLKNMYMYLKEAKFV